MTTQAPLPSIRLTAADSLQEQQRYTNALISIAQIKSRIQSGDVVTRTGNDFTSESLRNLCRRNTTYSHCGIASIEHDSVFIYHALGGEWNPDEFLKRESFEQFADPGINKGIGLFRFEMPEADKRRLTALAQHFYRQHLQFDMKFDLATDDRMYCAEFVYKSFKEASRQQVVFARSHIGDFTFIGVDDIFLHPACRKVTEIVYH